MKLSRRQFVYRATGAAALASLSQIAWAETYPTRPVRMIVPFAPRGPVAYAPDRTEAHPELGSAVLCREELAPLGVVAADFEWLGSCGIAGEKGGQPHTAHHERTTCDHRGHPPDASRIVTLYVSVRCIVRGIAMPTARLTYL